MRILFVHERLGSLGGAEANALITAREFKRKGHTVALLHGSGTGKGEETWFDTFEFHLLLDPSAKNARTAVEQFRPEVIYVHKMAELAVIEQLLSCKIPIVRMVHDHDIYCMRSYKYFYRSREICHRAASLYCVYGCGAFLARDRTGKLPLKYVSYFEKRREIALNQRFDRTITVSEFMKEQLIANGFEPKRIEIHPPVPRPGDPDLRSSFSDRNLIVYAGQIIRGKGVDVLLETLALLRIPFECVILGEGSHKPYCEKLAHELGLGDRVQFKGFIPQEELKNYYRECSVVAVSSVWPEPIATIGLEVMRYALPVVAFDAGGIRDWLHDGVNGFLIPWMDRRAFAAALERILLDKPLARKLGENGLALVDAHYSFDRYISGLEDLFARVMEEKKGRALPPLLPHEEAGLALA